MKAIFDMPILVFALSLILLCLSAIGGAVVHSRFPESRPEDDKDFGIILGATLTLLGLIIGFTFSMAISRYDQRKVYEEAEANAIGTEFVRADLLPGANASSVRGLLTGYLDQRIRFYQTRNAHELDQIGTLTTRLQNDLWSSVRIPALAQPNAVIALAVSGMNDVLNSQGYTQAAWWNRIPAEAWALMGVIAICSNVMLGYGIHRAKTVSILLVVLPLVLSVSFGLIADIDSPRAGLIRIQPQNLLSLAQSLRP
jgi:hypothetical protein